MDALADRLGRAAAEGPDAVAVAETSRSATYAALWEQARRFAGSLRRLGLGSGDRVASILPNGIEAVVACYGTWLASGIFVPLNIQARARDFETWLRHAQPRVIVHEGNQRDVHEACAALDIRPLRIVVGSAEPAPAESWEAVLEAALPAAPARTDPNSVAQILFTSGTTGSPKGVALSHANLAANVDSIIAYLRLHAGDSIVSVLPFYYSYGSSVLHTHLSVGARVCLEANLVFPQLLVERMVRERVTGFSGVPSTYALLLNRVPLAQYDLSGLRYLTQAGGAMSPALTARLRAALPHARLFVMYGQTEATARLTWLPPDRLDAKIGSVGIPIPGVEIAVRRDDESPAPAGETGNVWARGDNVMLGYWRNPEASREVLREGWLKTGDMGYLDAEGYLFLSGRRSDMIKTGAHRVHPKDVEEAIAELEQVAEVAVVGIDDELLGQTIRAFVVAQGPLTEDQVRAHCRARLASYKIPKQVVFVAALPRTASGKIRRAELAGSSLTQGVK